MEEYNVKTASYLVHPVLVKPSTNFLIHLFCIIVIAYRSGLVGFERFRVSFYESRIDKECYGYIREERIGLSVRKRGWKGITG